MWMMWAEWNLPNAEGDFSISILFTSWYRKKEWVIIKRALTNSVLLSFSLCFLIYQPFLFGSSLPSFQNLNPGWGFILDCGSCLWPKWTIITQQHINIKFTLSPCWVFSPHALNQRYSRGHRDPGHRLPAPPSVTPTRCPCSQAPLVNSTLG